MQYINTTFAHGNGPYSRCVEWAIEVNNIRETRGEKRLPIVVPLVYPRRQEKIMQEGIANNISPDFLKKHPYEILFDKTQGNLLNKLIFKGKDYADNLRFLAEKYYLIEEETHRHLDSLRLLETFTHELSLFDLRDCVFQLGLNNRIQTGLPNQFYTAGGAGPFDEILERAVQDEFIKIDKTAMKQAIPIAKRMMQKQKIIFTNEPGVFSYDAERKARDNEISTPPFIHPAKPDNTELPRKGIYVLMTGIDGVRESGMYDAIEKLGMQIYAPSFSIQSFPESIKTKAIPLSPNQINNPNIVAQYARAGWSTVWLSHMAEKGFITPKHQETDDPEIEFNQRGISKLGLGAIITDSPGHALQHSLELAGTVGKFNQHLTAKYRTLDGIRYAAEKVVDAMN